MSVLDKIASINYPNEMKKLNKIEFSCPNNKYTGWLKEPSNHSYNTFNALEPKKTVSKLHLMICDLPTSNEEEFKKLLEDVSSFIFNEKKPSNDLASSAKWVLTLFDLIGDKLAKARCSSYGYLDEHLNNNIDYFDIYHKAVLEKITDNGVIRTSIIKKRINELEMEIKALKSSLKE